jgi:predicted DNA binding CopG/RHH family protein/plasmid maintenance system antidote protein VapI
MTRYRTTMAESLQKVYETPQGYALVQKAKDLAKKFANNMTKAVAEIEKLEKGLSKNSTVDAELRKYNESFDEGFKTVGNQKGTEFKVYKNDKLVKTFSTYIQAHDYVKQQKEDLDESLEEGKMKDIFTADQEGKSAKEIAKTLKLPLATVKKILGEDLSIENLDEFTSDMIKRLKKSYSTMPKTLSTDQANALSRHLDRLDLVSLKKLAKEKIPFITTLAKNKIYKKTGKFEEYLSEEEPKLEPKEDPKKKDNKEGEIQSLKDQIAMLKTKLENEKNKAVKPEPNPETGEVPLTIGLAHKLLRDKEKKEVKEMAKDDAYAIGMAQAKKSMNDEPPLDKKTIKKGHEIAKKVMKKEIKEEIRLRVESMAALKKKADKSGMPYSILKKVFDRGMAAWKGGHRPGASQHQWAYARVNSFTTKSSGTWGGADKDLAAKVKGSK